MKSKQLIALAIGAALAVAVASPAVAQSTKQPGAYGKRMHHVMRGHAAYARAPAPQTCWVNGDKGAIDHGVFGYYAPCGTPGAMPAMASAWGPPRQ